MKIRITFRQVLSVVTFILIAVVLWNAREEVVKAVNYLAHTNVLIILLLIPEQLFMYYCCGKIFFSYMEAKKDAKKISRWNLMRISLELNFMNHAVPSGGVSGLGYVAWRLKPYGASPAQASFMYVLRYAVTTFANQAQTLIAIAMILIMGNIEEKSQYTLLVVGLISVAVIGMVIGGSLIASNKKALNWASRTFTKVANFVVKVVTFGKKKDALKQEVVDRFCNEIHEDFAEARRNKKIIKKPIFWGILYSFLEVATYWVVAISMGHPELLPQIMVAEAVGSVLGAVIPTPGGAGGYEASMAGVMWALGVDFGLATAVVVTTRVIVLVGTIVSGYGFYQHAIAKIGKEEKEEIKKLNKRGL
ncbi:flippase-like domain-containing protein [Candidatus Saccharibacteria bacterium]|nr:flippase-like domain-containing protein [Candidatus Saccharibacteria bacterium]